MHLAEIHCIFLAIATTLAVFNISKALDPVNGEDITFISHPQPSRCKIEPRSKMMKDMVSGQAETLKILMDPMLVIT
ncbi:uncharacterized protein BT62DRAFT_1005399 [Guyanagaster necrorhizus]|uniref:Uncharacterized protein n=1 Tax=Guyanagaster necrorhizus TaxID=856835 RepID=A0A9P7VW66_9AGAR|nr:uncharacterized protein BT62DRAFT_1005399 [Guyanagaster necrorhizus MCA 3950]KAG7446996.1 hypothetical protein BT62DRAFT_1005399 [Guyanagaster necrorhizus MCA 3950]